MVAEFHGRLFGGSGRNATACTLKRERDDVAGYEEASEPDWLDARDGFPVDYDTIGY